MPFKHGKLTQSIGVQASFTMRFSSLPFPALPLSRYDYFAKTLKEIEECEGSLEAFSRGYERFGFTIEADGVQYREWAPGVVEASLIGDFSNAAIEVELVFFC